MNELPATVITLINSIKAADRVYEGTNLTDEQIVTWAVFYLAFSMTSNFKAPIESWSHARTSMINLVDFEEEISRMGIVPPPTEE